MYGIVTGRMARRDTADVRTRARTYDQSVIGKPYFHQSSHSSVSLF